MTRALHPVDSQHTDLLDHRQMALRHARLLLDQLERDAVGASIVAYNARHSSLPTPGTALVFDGVKDQLALLRGQVQDEIDVLADAYAQTAGAEGAAR